MWNTMQNDPTVFVTNNEEGKNMVTRFKGKYAFFCETTVIKFYTHRDYSLFQVGEKLDTKEYGIGMPMNSHYREDINKIIIKLKEGGEMRDMYKKWWEPEFNEKGEKYADDEKKDDKDGTKPMGMDTVGGVFIVLIVGIAISLFLGFVEFLWAVRQTSIKFKITPSEAFRKEIAFNIRVWKLRKQIAPSSEQNSLSNHSDEEQVEEINLRPIGNGEQNGSKTHRD